MFRMSRNTALGLRLRVNDRNNVGRGSNPTIFPSGEGESEFGFAFTGFAWDPHGAIEQSSSAALGQSHLDFDGRLPQFAVGELDLGDRMGVCGDAVAVVDKDPLAPGILSSDLRC